MKVLKLVKYYSPSKGGVETVTKNIVSGIIAFNKGFNFTIYTNSHIKNKYDIITKNPDELIITKSINYFFKNQPLKFLFSELKNLIQQNDIIHLHYPYPNIEIALFFLKSNLKKKKFIITWHANVENSRWKVLIPLYSIIINNLLKSADSVVITSPNLLENSKLLLKYKSKVSIIPLSFSPIFKCDFVKDRLPNKPFKLLFVGKLRSYKGVDVLIQSILELDVILTIVGDGPELESLTNLVNYLNIKNKVIFKSQVSNDILLSEYSAADLFVLPSINEAEAFGLVQLEAMSFGLPVINTKLNSGVPFVSINEYTGYTVKPNDISEMRTGISKIFSSQIVYNQFSNNAKKRVLEFTNEKMSKSYYDLYLNLF